MHTLNKALTANLITSLLSGLTLVIFPKAIAQVFGVNAHPVFMGVGIALLFFASTIALELKKQRALAIWWISMQDLMWVASSFIILLWQPFPISATGYWIIDVVALLILLLAIFQLKGLAALDTHNGAKVMQFSRVMPANKAQVWDMISDLGNYHQVAPNIDGVKILSGGSGEGTVRQCSHGKDSWQETCTLWQPQKRYVFEVDTNAPNYPFPFSYLKGTWELSIISDNETEVTMKFEAVYKRGFYNWLVHPLAKLKFDKTGEELLDNWQAQALS